MNLISFLPLYDLLNFTIYEFNKKFGIFNVSLKIHLFNIFHHLLNIWYLINHCDQKMSLKFNYYFLNFQLIKINKKLKCTLNESEKNHLQIFIIVNYTYNKKTRISIIFFKIKNIKFTNLIGDVYKYYFRKIYKYIFLILGLNK